MGVVRTGRRAVIFNADDFGQSPGVNVGVIRAHESGVLTSASMMTRWPAAVEAAAYARRRPQLSVGLHLDFGESVFRGGQWESLYRVCDVRDASAVARELSTQLDAFQRMVGSPPTHLDSHQHVHRHEPVKELVLDAARRWGIPVREVSGGVTYIGNFYGQDDRGVSYPGMVSPAALIDLLSGLGPGVTEIGCHPSAADDLDTMYRSERLIELETLCDPDIRVALDEMQLQLCAFHQQVSHEE